MELRRLFMRNFLAVGDEGVELLFTKKNGITVIKGNNQDVSSKSSNGSGKSTIVEGIYYGLSGYTLRKLNLEGMVHNARAGDCLVELEFDDVKIIRTITAKRNISSVKFIEGGKDKTTASGKETNKLIDEKVGLNAQALSNILIFGQHNIISFLDAPEKEKREIIENLMNLREYNEYEQIARDKAKEAKIKLKNATDRHGVHSSHLAEQQAILSKQEQMLVDYRSGLMNEIRVLDAHIASVPDLEQLKDLWDRYNSYLENKKQLEDKINQLVQQNNNYQAEYNQLISDKQKESENKQPLVDKLNSFKSKFLIIEERRAVLTQSEVYPLVMDQQSYQEKILDARRRWEAGDATIQLKEDWDYQRKSLDKLIVQQKNRIGSICNKGLKDNETCPTCFGKVSIENAHNIVKSIEAEIKQLEKQYFDLVAKEAADLDFFKRSKEARREVYETEVILYQSKLDDIIKKLEETKLSIETGYAEAKQKLDSFVLSLQNELANFDSELNNKHNPIIQAKQLQIDEINKQLQVVKRQLDGLSVVLRPKIAIEELSQLQSKLDSDNKLKAEKAALISNNPYIHVITSLKDNITKINADVKSVEVEIKELESKIPYYDFWVNHMGSQGLKSFVIDQILPTLNKQISYWMKFMYNDAITVQFDKYLNVSIKNNSNDQNMIFGQASGGERRRIDIAIMLAFRQVMQLSNGRKPNMIFLDEVGENLDELGIYSLNNTIKELAKDNFVYIITHNPTLLQLLENETVMNIEKNHGVMKIVS